MIVRNFIRCTVSRRLQVCRPRLRPVKSRSYSTSSSAPPTSNSSPASMLGTFTNELDRIAPRFEVEGSQISVLRSPSEFYETLKVGRIYTIAGTRADDGTRPKY